MARAVETLLEKVMFRMETAVDTAMLPNRRGDSGDSAQVDLNVSPTAQNCLC